MTIPFIEENDQTTARKQHLSEIEQLVGNVYPNKFVREVRKDSEIVLPDDRATISAIVHFEPVTRFVPPIGASEPPSHEQRDADNAELNKFKVRIAGRIATPPRIMGKAAFVHLSDGVSRLQIYVRKQDARAISNDDYQAIENETAGWQLMNLLDHGDFIGVSGFLFITKTGELSIHVETLQFLAKALLPMPDKIHGISDPEIQRRYRYADLIADSLKIKTPEELEAEHESGKHELTTREVFERRAKLISGMRNYLDAAGYIEVETPMLTPKATGAAAKPFETHHNALDIPLYARIAPELYLKRLLVGGFEKVYELNRNFRNEGLSNRHNPEFTMLEFYCAYMDANGMMDFAEKMIREAVQRAIGGTKANTQQTQGLEPVSVPKYRGSRSTLTPDDEVTNLKYISVFNNKIDFSRFERLTMKEAIARESNFGKVLVKEDIEDWLGKDANIRVLSDFLWWIDDRLPNEVIFFDGAGESVEKLTQDETDKLVENKWQEINEKYADVTLTESERAKYIISVFEDFVEENLIQPTFITDFPKIVSPLSKASPENPQIAERFELFVNGMECANGFSELNAPKEQYERFLDQAEQRTRGDDEAMVLDEDYIRALSYGMPPAAGIGIGIDRLVMLLTNRHSIRDVILFPHLRPEHGKIETENAANQ